jgi:hypothetical protein
VTPPEPLHGYRLWPSRSASSHVHFDEATISRHLHLAGDDAFHEEAIQDLVVQQIQKGLGALVFYPASSDTFLPAAYAAAAQSGRERDLVVLDFVSDQSTHFFEPAHHDAELSPLKGYLSWLVRTLAERGTEASLPRSAFRLPGLKVASDENPLVRQCVEMFGAYTDVLQSLRHVTTLSDIIDVLSSDDIVQALVASADSKQAPSSFTQLNEFPKGFFDWRHRSVSRLVRLQRVCRTTGRGKPALALNPTDSRRQVICVAMPDVLERMPGAELSEALGVMEVAALLALGVLARVSAAACTARRSDERNSLLLVVPELFRWAPREVLGLVEQARTLKIAMVQYTRHPLRAVELGDSAYCIESMAYTHIGRTLDLSGKFVLVHFNSDSRLAEVVTEA